MSPQRLFPFIVAVVLLLVSGLLYHGLGKDSSQLDSAAARVGNVPLEIGEWKAQSTQPDKEEEEAFAQAGAKGYWSRIYVQERTGNSVLVILMCGRAGKMSVHTPEICYRGAGYEMHAAPTAMGIKNERKEELGRFWAGHFTKRTGTAKNLRLYWAWNAQGKWQAPGNPRWQFRGEPFLYKLYLSHDRTQPAGSEAADPAADLLRQLLPELNRALAPPQAA